MSTGINQGRVHVCTWKPCLTMQVFRILRILRLQRVFAYAESEVNRQLARILLSVVAVIFITAGLMQILEEGHAKPCPNRYDVSKPQIIRSFLSSFFTLFGLT